VGAMAREAAPLGQHRSLHKAAASRGALKAGEHRQCTDSSKGEETIRLVADVPENFLKGAPSSTDQSFPERPPSRSHRSG
jgi:hypothetical protein